MMEQPRSCQKFVKEHAPLGFQLSRFFQLFIVLVMYNFGGKVKPYTATACTLLIFVGKL